MGEDVDPAEYSTPTFSPEFLAKYGNVVAWPRAWRRLMSTSFYRKLIPKYEGKFLFVAENISFLDFCKASDLKVREMKGQFPVLGRQELKELGFKS